jgi:hypothetical protein
LEDFLNRLYGFDTSKIENRKYLRFPLSLAAECHYNTCKTVEKAKECTIIDVCEQGLGFEMDTHAGIYHGQKVLLSIVLPDKKLPVNAIVQLQWAKIPCEGALKRRVGSRLLFIDPKEKAHLLQYAYAMILVGVSKNSFALRAMDIRYPKFHYLSR